jgi:hypothetical protein
MLETYFSATKMLGHLRNGPSGPYLDGFAEVLERQGYGPETAVRAGRSSHWPRHDRAMRGPDGH